MNNRIEARPSLRHLLSVSIMLAAVSGVFFGCSGERDDTASSTPDSVYIAAGNKITASAFDTLRGALLETMEKAGAEGAITFCNVNALQITQHEADTFSIKRTASRYRNPANQPDSLEWSILLQMSDEAEMKKIPEVRLVRTNESIHYFRPIMMQAMCLNCHGTHGNQIAPSTLARINELYPNDNATHFKEGDLRGLWHVIFRISARQ